MLGVYYKTKKELKENIGKQLEYEETSMFGNEYKATGKNVVVGHPYTKRDYFSEVILEDGIIKKVA